MDKEQVGTGINLRGGGGRRLVRRRYGRIWHRRRSVGSGFVFTEENYNNGYTSSNYTGGTWGLGEEYFLDANSYTISGDSSMPNPEGGTMIGKTGGGFAKITMVETTEDIITLTLNGEEEITILAGSNYEDAGAILIINNEDMSEEINIEGSVDVDTAGNYTITYSYEGYSVTRRITVIDPVTELNIDYNYLGSVQTYIIPKTGRYRLETWGGSGRSTSKSCCWKWRIFRRNS